jgi:hypothetical protein
MLNEGNAVKGTPDKEPTYESPTPDVKTKYKKVEQSPEVDEQDGIYPATTLTDIPKVKANKKVKNESDGLEPIKDNDTKNEMKKVKVVKEGIHDKDITSASHTNIKTPPKGTGDYDPKKRAASLARLKNFGPKTDEKELKEAKSFDDIFADFIETDDSTEIKAYLKDKGKEAITKIKSKITKVPDQIRTKLAKLLKVELDEIKTKKVPFDYKSTFEDLVVKTNTAGKSDFSSLKQDWLKRVENSQINQDTKKQMIGKINTINSLLDLQKFASYGLLRYEKMAVKENKKSALESLVTKVMNETLSKKSAK